ncbi:unnamed protein product [Lasius platythorax]|uniref:Uncharacterized protein n=1 Tax=Lasius platythorax TaxID=488582 RepID=A0AAV2MY93_9HYME
MERAQIPEKSVERSGSNSTARTSCVSSWIACDPRSGSCSGVEHSMRTRAVTGVVVPGVCDNATKEIVI